MSDNWTWQPVEEPIGPVELEIEYYTHGDSDTATHYDAGHLGGDWVSLGGDIVTTINWGAHEDYRLCRRVPGMGVPESVVDAINGIILAGNPMIQDAAQWGQDVAVIDAWIDTQTPHCGREDSND